MSRVLSAGGQKVGIADYMAVYPFVFQKNKLLIHPQDARVVVNILSAQATGRSEWSSRLAEVRRESTFAIEDDDGHNLVVMKGFEMKRASMAMSLDVGIARFVLGGTVNRETGMEFDAPRSHFGGFARSRGKRQLWGGMISGEEGDKQTELLRASLSAPKYETSDGICFVEEYAALGPANSHGGGEKESASLFQWIVSRGRPMSAQEGEQLQPTAASEGFARLAVRDEISGRSNEFGGGDEASAVKQLSLARGAVFVVNGYWLLTQTPWRELLRTVRTVADQDVNDDVSTSALLDRFAAASDWDQTALQTSQEVRFTARGIDTDEYEGILLWGLGDPDSGERSDFMHG